MLKELFCKVFDFLWCWSVFATRFFDICYLNNKGINGDNKIMCLPSYPNYYLYIQTLKNFQKKKMILKIDQGMTQLSIATVNILISLWICLKIYFINPIVINSTSCQSFYEFSIRSTIFSFKLNWLNFLCETLLVKIFTQYFL